MAEVESPGSAPAAALADTVETLIDTVRAPPGATSPTAVAAAADDSGPVVLVAEARSSKPAGSRPAQSGATAAGSPAGSGGGSARSTSGGSGLSQTLAAGSESYDSALGFEPTPSPDSGEEVGADPLIGMIVAERYRIVERIGRGGMGIVYRVEHIRIGKLLAMKLLAGELSTNKEVVRRFQQEALTVSKLSSPYTVQVFDYGVYNHLTYLIMELVDGSDLGRPLRREGPMPFTRLGKLMVQVCSSLAEAHEKGIVHRDIKPENIMIVSDSRGGEMAKVLDFGLAKLRDSAELNEVTLQGSVIGTPYYMSPEQVTGEEVDGRTDIYSLGALMFRALTGSQAFQAATPMGMFTKHLTEKVPSASRRNRKAGIPERVSAAIERCMAKDPAERFQTIEALRELLIEELAGAGLPSSERVMLLDEPATPSAAARLAAARERAESASEPPPTELAASIIAIRRELEAYERKLRRKRYGSWALGLLMVAGGGAAAGYWALRASRAHLATTEHEPNDTAAAATPLSLGKPLSGQIGGRPEPGRGDRDFYAFTLPSSDGPQYVTLRVSAIPAFATCSMLYRVGFEQPLARYCAGRPGVDLVIPALRIDSGALLLAVVQDMTPGPTGEPSPIYESVTDSYSISVDVAQPGPTDEVEPNDTLRSAQPLAPGGAIEGHLGWRRDEDVYCASGADPGTLGWEVSDGPRPVGTVLEITPWVGGSPGPLVRLHGESTKPFGRPRLEADVTGAWTSVAYPAGEGDRCLQLRLTSDPWADEMKGRAVKAGPSVYRVRLLAR